MPWAMFTVAAWSLAALAMGASSIDGGAHARTVSLDGGSSVRQAAVDPCGPDAGTLRGSAVINRSGLATPRPLSLDSDFTLDAGTPVRPIVLGDSVDEARVQRVLASLDTRARAGQMVLAYPQIDKTKPCEVGGVLFVGNLLRRPGQAQARIAWSKAHAKVPPFFAIDMEGGSSNRMKKISSVAALPSAKDMAQLSDAQVERWGVRVGLAMHEVGLNLNLAPVLDVAETGHMARNARSFSGDRRTVARRASAYAKGLLSQGVMPIGKHFPGYGDLDGDSDHALVTTDWERTRVLEEIAVFENTTGLGGVMLANVVYTSFENTPAVVSTALVKEAHARGFVSITDDLSIQLLADAIGGTPEDVFAKAFLAGNDLLLTTAPPDWNKGVDYLGVLTRLANQSPGHLAMLEQACTRVLRLKDRMGLLDGL